MNALLYLNNDYLIDIPDISHSLQLYSVLPYPFLNDISIFVKP